MTKADRTITELVGEIGAYHMVKTKFAADKEQAGRIIEKCGAIYADANIDTSDGCRFDFDDGWVHLRTSNTEPIMRAIVETQTPEAAAKYLEVVDRIRDEVI